MVSRSHLEAAHQGYVDGPVPARRSCVRLIGEILPLAEGAADLYPRLAPTHDWDIAAGHAILVAAGGKVVTPDGSPLTYGTKELADPGVSSPWRSAPTSMIRKSGRRFSEEIMLR